MTEPYSWIDGEWISGNPPIIGPLTNAAWMATVVFDGARAFDGLAPDLDLHAERCIASAIALGLDPKVSAKEIQRLAIDGLSHFTSDTAVYIRPMFYGDEGWLIPTTTKFCLTLFELPMNPAEQGLSVCKTTRVAQHHFPPPQMQKPLAFIQTLIECLERLKAAALMLQ